MIRARVLGPLEVSVDGAPAPPDLLWRKHLALLIYLARSPNRARSRDHLLSLLWSEKDEDAARHSLNEAVRILRRSAPDGVDRQQDRIQLSAAAVELDVDTFEGALEQEDYATAVSFVYGEFMEGFTVADTWGFEEWLAHERSHWRARSLLALNRYAQELLTRGDAREALAVTERARALEPVAEEAARIALQCYAVLGERAGALRYYEDFAQTLEDQLGVAPQPEMAELVERIRAERTWLHIQNDSVVAADRRAPLIGATDNMAALVRAWRTCAQQRRSALATIEGDAGTGKSRLLEELAVRARLDGGQVMSVRAIAADRTAPGAVRAILTQAQTDGPVLLCIDDAHFLDAETAAEITRLLRDRRHAPLMIALAFLPQSACDEIEALRARVGRDLNGVAIKTRAFTGDELRTLARWFLPTYDDAQIERLGRRLSADSAGLPFLAIELLYAIANGLDLTHVHTAWPAQFQTFEQTLPGGLPEAAVAAIRVGFRKLTSDAQTTLAAAAVVSLPAPAALLARATGLAGERLHRALDELEWQRWLNADARGYSFVARIARDIIQRDMLTEGQRQRILEATAVQPA